MVSSPVLENLVYNIKLSSVGPGSVTRPDTVFEPNGMDLAMKLHYIRGIYYFESCAFEDLTTLTIKDSVFKWLNQFPVMCGRFRRDDSGRPYIKCNDCGVRFVEGKCDKTLDEWLEMKDSILEKLLVPNQCIGPELGFSPLVFLQFTKFKCGGMAVGLSWAHVLGDSFFAAEFMNKLGSHVLGHYETDPPITAHKKSTTSTGFLNNLQDPLAMKRINPVGDNWVNVTNCKMESFSIKITSEKLSDLQMKLTQHGTVFSPFEVLSAVIWQCIAKIRGENSQPNVVTIMNKNEQNNEYGILSNSQVVSLVRADFSIVGANLSDIATLMKKEAVDERKKIEEAMEREHGLADFIIYGANLTFVNLDEARFNNFKYRGYMPVDVSYRIDGVGEQGSVLILPGSNDGSKNEGGARAIMVILPENEVIALKEELTREGLVV